MDKVKAKIILRKYKEDCMRPHRVRRWISLYGLGQLLNLNIIDLKMLLHEMYKKGMIKYKLNSKDCVMFLNGFGEYINDGSEYHF